MSEDLAQSVAYDPARLQNLIEKMDTIPALPLVADRMLAMIEDPDINIEEVSELLTSDQALSARILRLVNSAFFGLSQHVESIHRAVTLVGLNSIRQICLGLVVFDMFNKDGKGSKQAVERLWKHSLCVALAARTVARMACCSQPDVAFTGGLLHDVGEAILLAVSPEGVLKSVENAEQSHTSLLEAETMVLGFDHRHVGGWLVGHWKLPHPIHISVLWHHGPNAKTWETKAESDLVTAVALGDSIANFLGLHFAKAAPDVNTNELLTALNLEASEVAEASRELKDEVDTFYRTL